ncbi:hypothetical protein FUAX_34620 [Fulvitalea axinellae]|uniref:Vitellogenin II n=1 Tax=Fulvitalea axinellae TaxID=1182444 RepID=A0AAU9CNP0_9BACT|nr:hypothetical protein FUAX_34620 [Fulvitalea axinellae]
MKPTHLFSITLMAILSLVLFHGQATAQGEYDDMYFNSKDRQKAKAIKISQREQALSNTAYASSKTYSTDENYSARTVDPNLIERYKRQALAQDSLAFVANLDTLDDTSDYSELFSAADYVMSEETYKKYGDKKEVASERRPQRNNWVQPNFSFGFGYATGPWGWSMGPTWSYGVRWGSPYYGAYDPFYDPFYNPWYGPWGPAYAYGWHHNRYRYGYPHYGYGNGNVIIVNPENGGNSRRIVRGSAPSRGGSTGYIPASSSRRGRSEVTGLRSSRTSSRSSISNSSSRMSRSASPNVRSSRSSSRSRNYAATQNEYFQRSQGALPRTSGSRSRIANSSSRSSRSAGNSGRYSSSVRKTMPAVQPSRSSSSGSRSYSSPRSRSTSRSYSNSGSRSYSSGSNYSGSRSSYSRSSSSGSRSSYSRSRSSGSSSRSSSRSSGSSSRSSSRSRGN